MKLFRILGVVALALCWLVGAAIGATSVGLRTANGRSALVRIAVAIANRAIDGTIAIGGVSGSLLSGLTAREIVVRDAKGSILAEIAEIEVGYGLNDLVRRRFVLGHLRVESPRLRLEQDAEGKWNIQKIFGGNGGTRTGPVPFVAFSDVEITNAAVEVRTRFDGPVAAVFEIEHDSVGPVRVRRFTDINAFLPYLRLVSPLPGQPTEAEISAFSVRGSDPEIDLVGLRGTVQLSGDSLYLDLAEATLPDSGIAVDGTFSWATGPLRPDIEVVAVDVATDPVRQFVSELPPGMAASGRFRVRAASDEILSFTGNDLSIRGVGGGGVARGQLGLVVGPGRRVAFRSTTLDLENLDLEYVRAYFDTLPFAGRVTGRFEASGRTDSLTLGLNIMFSDSMVPGWPASTVMGTGIVTLGGPGSPIFRNFTMSDARIDLGTARRIIPAIDLQGTFSGNAVLDGPLLQLSFDGEFRHRDRGLPESVARGVVRIDGRGDTLGVWADMVLDSLVLDGLVSSYPNLKIGGAFAGPVMLTGYLDSLETHAELSGPGGRVAVDGALRLVAGNRGAHFLESEATALDLKHLNPALPTTSLAGALQGSGSTGGNPVASVGIELVQSSVLGVAVDSARVAVGVADSTLLINALQVWGNRLSASGSGTLGLTGSREGGITVFAAVDSIGALRPILERVFGTVDTTGVGDRTPSGSIWAGVQLQGSLDDFELTTDFELSQIQRGAFALSHAEGNLTWSPRDRVVELVADVESADAGTWTIGNTEVDITGEVIDSVAWRVWAHRFGRDGILIAGGRLNVESGVYEVPVDSMMVLLATGVWSLDPGGVVKFDSAGLDFVDIGLRNPGRGEISVKGRIPFQGPGGVIAQATGIPVQDVWALLHEEYEEVGGFVSGRASLGGTARSPTIEGEFELQEGVFGDFRAPFVGTTASYANQRLVADIGLWRRGERILDVDVELPIELGLTDVPERLLPGELSVRGVASEVDLSILDLVTPAVQRAAGALTADVGITGSWEEPQLTGHVRLTNGSGRIPGLGVRHQDLNGSLRLSGDTIRVERLSLRSGQGRAEVTGFVRLEELSRPILELAIDARGFDFIDVRDFVAITGSGDLRLRGPVYQASLTGRGTVTEGVLYFADLVEKDVIDLEDPLYGQLIDRELIRQQGLGRAFENRFLDSLRVDSLVLGMGGDVWLRSSEANIQLLGTVTLNKRRNEYRINGTLETPRGTYRLQPRFVGELITREFEVTRGRLNYFGTPDLDAAIDIDARHVVRTVRGDNVTVFVNLGGTIYDPQLTLTSDIRPAISDAEIICYLFLSGSCAEGPFAGGNTQDQVVNQFLGALSGQAEYFFISDLRVPLDYLQIRPGIVGTRLAGTEIALGKRFGDRWFVTVSPRICPDQFFAVENVGASVEYRFSRRWLLSLSGEPAQSCLSFRTSTLQYQLGADLFWEKSY